MDSKRTFAIVIVLVLTGAWFIFSQAGNQSAQTILPQMPEAQENALESVSLPVGDTSTEAEQSPVVLFTENGFSPKSLEVSAGETVVFLNTSGRSMWVASAQHPTHSVYPEFDQKKGVVEGETFEFVFSKKGTWPYHNHLSPKDFGNIIVK